MRKVIYFVTFILMSQLANAWFLSNLFHADGSTHRHKTTAKTIDYSAAFFQQYCQSQPLKYGVHIVCQQPMVTTQFKADASDTVRCSQKYRGINNQFPANVVLSSNFLQTLNKCNGSIYGPALFHQTTVVTESNNTFVQNNGLQTNYDIVCDTSAGFESGSYSSTEQKNNLLIQNEIQQCISNAEKPQARSFLYVFYFFVLIALIAFAIIGWGFYSRRRSNR
jgi:hypothetical protein